MPEICLEEDNVPTNYQPIELGDYVPNQSEILFCETYLQNAQRLCASCRKLMQTPWSAVDKQICEIILEFLNNFASIVKQIMNHVNFSHVYQDGLSDTFGMLLQKYIVKEYLYEFVYPANVYNHIQIFIRNMNNVLSVLKHKREEVCKMGVNNNNESLEGTAFTNAMNRYDGTSLNPGIESTEWKDMQACVIGVKGIATTNAESSQRNADEMTKRMLETFESVRTDDTELSDNENNYIKNDVVFDNVQTTKGQPNETLQNFDNNSIKIDPALQKYAKIGREIRAFANENNSNDNAETHPQRMSKDEYYLGIAEAVAKRGTCLRRKFGAVIYNNDRIVSTGYVGAPRGRQNCIDIGSCFRMKNNIQPGTRYELCRSCHAEMNAIIHGTYSDMIGAKLYLVGIENDGSYTEADCCAMCKRAIINAQIDEVIFRTKSGGIKIASVQSWIDNDDSLDINHKGY